MNRILDVATSLAVSAARLGQGLSADRIGPRPEKLLELYEFEACPYCRKVREALTAFDLDALVYPCPKGGRRFREQALRLGGKQQFPLLVDPNSEVVMYESDDIVAYLAEQYGNGERSWLDRLGPLNTVGSVLASLYRPTMGSSVVASRAPAKPLELWSFEASPFCRLVREALCSLELPYVLHNVGKGSPKREDFVRRSGKMMVPFLVDPNTDKEMFESADIVAYLFATYAA